MQPPDARTEFDLVVATVDRTTDLCRARRCARSADAPGISVSSSSIRTTTNGSRGFWSGTRGSRRCTCGQLAGLSRARNVAIPHLRAGLVAFPDDDCLIRARLARAGSRAIHGRSRARRVERPCGRSRRPHGGPLAGPGAADHAGDGLAHGHLAHDLPPPGGCRPGRHVRRGAWTRKRDALVVRRGARLPRARPPSRSSHRVRPLHRDHASGEARNVRRARRPRETRDGGSIGYVIARQRLLPAHRRRGCSFVPPGQRSCPRPCWTSRGCGSTRRPSSGACAVSLRAGGPR